ncbi:MAG: hypothetical protein ACRYGC_10925 [Janthinobacterium lividum]
MVALPVVACVSRMTPRVRTLAVAGICLAGAVLDLVFLAAGAEPASLKLPAGLPGFGATLSLDPLSGLFLLPMLAGAGACCLGGVEPAGRRGPGGAPATPALACCLAALVLTLLAGDGFTLVLAAAAVPGLATLCGRGDAAPRPAAPGATRQFGLLATTPGPDGTVTATPGEAAAGGRGVAAAVLGAVLDPVSGTVLAGLCLAAAVALLVPVSGLLAGPVFAAIRAHPPEGWRAAAVLALSLLGTARTCGLFPGGSVPATGAPGEAERAAALLAAVPLAGVYVLARLVPDLCGPATPLWWGVPMLLAGGAAVAAGGLHAATAARMEGITAGVVAGSAGVAVAGLGVALLGRAADLPLLAALALGGTGLVVLAQGPLVALLGLAAAGGGRAAGTTVLARLGGLLGRMPVAGACLMLAAATVARLPVSAGFPGGWMVAESLLQAPRLGGPWLGVALALALAAGACGTALFAAAALRLVGTALLGRPRSPRGAAADDATAPARQVLVALAAVLGLIGVMPPLALALAGPAVTQLSLAVPEGAANAAWTVSPLRDGSGYAALPLAGLVALAAGALAWAMRGRMARGAVERPGWEGGFAAPPPWLPFGDPETQLGPHAIDAPLRRMADALMPARPVAGASGGAALRDAGLALLRAAGRCEARMGAAPLPWLLAVVAGMLCLLAWGVGP